MVILRLLFHPVLLFHLASQVKAWGKKRKWCYALSHTYTCSAQLPGTAWTCVCTGFGLDTLQEGSAGHNPLQLGATSFLQAQFPSQPSEMVVLEHKSFCSQEG